MNGKGLDAAPDLTLMTEYLNTKMSISDASSTLRKNVPRNAPPYVQKVIELNNQLVDKWERELLVHYADEQGKVNASIVWDLWKCYEEGLSILESRKYLQYIPRLTDEQMNFWKEFFEQDIDVIYTYGSGIVNRGWNLFMDEHRFRLADAKYTEIYSSSDNPVDWYKSYNNNRRFTNIERCLPEFWTVPQYKDIFEKVTILLKTQISPEKLTEVMPVDNVRIALKHKIMRNTPPYTKTIMEANNRLVDQFIEKMLKHIPTRNGTVSGKTVWEMWMCFYEGQGVSQIDDVSYYIPRLTEDQIKFWTSFFDHELDEIYNHGYGMINRGWNILLDEHRSRLADKKYEKICKGVEEPIEWWNNLIKNSEFFDQDKLRPIFWEKDTFLDINDKVMTILRFQVNPE
jgi:hypothetical protein